MKAEILAVGTELLLGDIVNTNAQYIARRLADLGISVYHHSVVGDNPERLKDAYELAFKRADLVITTGGLGPTKDDLTKEIAAEYFNKELVVDEESMKKIEEYSKRNNRPVLESNKKQAYMPKGCIILKNDHGSAPGCIIEDKGKILIMMPGPPREMKPMFENYAVPYLEKFSDGVLVSRVLRVLGLGESEMEDRVKDIIDSQDNPTVAPYVKDGEATLRITSKANIKEEAVKLLVPMESNIRERLGDYIYGVDDTTIEEVVAKLLIDKNLTIATAESCTGGLIASKLINYPGISSVFMEGVVSYSNDAKVKRLGVKKETLDKYGAVSKETAEEMAVGIAKTAGTDIGISVTGIAGPDGGTAEKPVGLVYVGLYIKGSVKTKKLNFWGDRQNIRNRTAISALDWLRREIK
ncbi:putative competence-damage inducible protein [Oxobacter pfennigii]|uniref:Putative competence-damage inducible protein n=1 Tax=Oxobacter pfennigii TaxID=36849 RepID=A0A0P8WQB4_9CLOT|nr:competence/damage-inducible protein A [Oxobacter pfennigii]KPU44734.1 putative competence-damage inducible protein [Oxobacter pfennigii]